MCCPVPYSTTSRLSTAASRMDELSDVPSTRLTRTCRSAPPLMTSPPSTQRVEVILAEWSPPSCRTSTEQKSPFPAVSRSSSGVTSVARSPITAGTGCSRRKSS
eukprot:scaffold304090_cov33-Tisochrysis_lutea.AAC.2